MKTIAGLFLVLFGLLVATGFCGEAKSSLDVQGIVARSNHAALYQGADMRGAVTMTITDKQGRVRTRRFNMIRKNGDAKDQAQKYFVCFLEPADVRRMVFMVHKHGPGAQDDDRWMYLPSLDLVKRIAASDKRTSFVGSDFLYEDISGRNIDEDIHELVGATDRHYIVKNTPKNPRSVEFSHYVAHIDKETFLPMKLEYHRAGRVYRVAETLAVEKIPSGEAGQPTYATAVRSRVNDLDSGGSTEMVISRVRYNQKPSDDLFTERCLRRAPSEFLR
ncbi:Outer membrane lipoprotein-sorting protein [Humidesulfovibrio mexicanus]|uniref:Outer membrane lipoprotein-sorting protein n=1 Tax=Humidesulfovibrio mexicanus TaxID=147047 RepID=A0A238Y7P7_9BACT|nr:outer membrane lipoprotein-sorting protein [Humidesulfovibrio mexicanus]SNR67107.1 Outer membrane lipoprotein-sorting protein [Humidesulfovibrio mexicanus]